MREGAAGGEAEEGEAVSASEQSPAADPQEELARLRHELDVATAAAERYRRALEELRYLARRALEGQAEQRRNRRGE